MSIDFGTTYKDLEHSFFPFSHLWILCIPLGQDYFEVIETPMDFGTIRKDLEHGQKYLNSKDVFKDVQFIWENCYKYNNKGDYILDLMKRVKRNFMKYWTAAGLSTDLTGNGSIQPLFLLNS